MDQDAESGFDGAARRAILRGLVVTGSLVATSVLLVLVLAATTLLPLEEVRRGARELALFVELAFALGAGVAAAAFVEDAAPRGTLVRDALAGLSGGVASLALLVAVALSLRHAHGARGSDPAFLEIGRLFLAEADDSVGAALPAALPLAVLTFARRLAPRRPALQTILVGTLSLGPLFVLWALLDLPRTRRLDEGFAPFVALGLAAFLSFFLPGASVLGDALERGLRR